MAGTLGGFPMTPAEASENSMSEPICTPTFANSVGGTISPLPLEMPKYRFSARVIGSFGWEI